MRDVGPPSRVWVGKVLLGGRRARSPLNELEECDLWRMNAPRSRTGARSLGPDLLPRAALANGERSANTKATFGEKKVCATLFFWPRESRHARCGGRGHRGGGV